MDNVKNDNYYINRLREDVAFIVKNMKDVSEEELNDNEVLLDSMMFRLIQISENAKKLSDDYKSKNSDIPWVAIYGLRNRIVHDYGSVDLGIIYSTLTEDIPDLVEYLRDEEKRF